MRKAVVIVGIVLLLGAVPAVVLAMGVRISSALDRQVSEWTSRPASTSSTSWRNVPRLGSVEACTLRQVTATLSVTISGAPALFRVVIDTPEAPMRPGPAHFVPDAKETFSATFVRTTIPFEDDDSHVFSVQWRSPTGEQVRLASGVLNLAFQQGTHNCP